MPLLAWFWCKIACSFPGRNFDEVSDVAHQQWTRRDYDFVCPKQLWFPQTFVLAVQSNCKWTQTHFRQIQVPAYPERQWVDQVCWDYQQRERTICQNHFGQFSVGWKGTGSFDSSLENDLRVFQQWRDFWAPINVVLPRVPKSGRR